MKNNKLIIFSIFLLGVVFLINIVSNKDNNLHGKYYVEMKVEGYGIVELELDSDNSPITVTNFMNLVRSGYYDGLTFHRIIDNFMVQGGSGDSRPTIKGEFSSNGVENNISHTRGVISMARSDNYNSASTQFFIVQADSTYLDGLYAAFGKVIEGMDVIDAMAKVKVEDDNGTVLKENQPVIEYIKEIKK